MRNPPTNSDDVIDSRDVIERIEELEADRAEFSDALESAQESKDTQNDEEDAPDIDLHDAVIEAREALELWDASDAAAELGALKALAEQAEGYAPDWKHGETLIRDSYFKDYAQELADDIGAINSAATWPNNCIDWDRAARELQSDYTSVKFDGVTYWVR